MLQMFVPLRHTASAKYGAAMRLPRQRPSMSTAPALNVVMPCCSMKRRKSSASATTGWLERATGCLASGQRCPSMLGGGVADVCGPGAHHVRPSCARRTLPRPEAAAEHYETDRARVDGE